VPTRQGLLVAVGAVALALAGRLLGAVELYVLAAGAGALQVVALLTARLRRPRLEVARHVRPARVHAGGDSRVELVVRNRGARRSSVVTLKDAVVIVRPEAPAGTAPRQARFHVAPLDPEGADRAAYRLGAERRGLFRVGPLQAVVTDPFGLASVSSEIAPATELTVYPKVEVVTPLPLTTGHDPRAGGGHPTFVGHGDEFFALRAYETGDDLRRVHWPSTARRDELMIRQHEMPWQGRATVLLDVRAAAHTGDGVRATPAGGVRATPAGDSLEQAVSAAASLLTANWHLDSQVRLLTTDGLDSGFGTGAAHLNAMMEHLAVVEAGEDRLDPLIAALHRQPTGALVVVTTTSTAVSPLERLTTMPGRFGWVAAVLVAPRPAESRPVPTGVLAVRVEPGQSFAAAWDRALATPGVTAVSR
jgi:uncharacterized protein (DUF58 family)